MLPSYQASFLVSITCEACIEDISSALKRLPGMREFSFSLPSTTLTTTGTEPPSSIISAIRATGRKAILRGSGDANSAAVCILETPSAHSFEGAERLQVCGLVRFIELSQQLTMLDMTLSGLPPDTYNASLRNNGDVSSVPISMGDVFAGVKGNRMGDLGRLEVDRSGKGNLQCMLDWHVWEMVGRGVLVEGTRGRHRGGIVAGVVARSAGIWENEKVVCGCSGKTVWEEHADSRGIP